MPRSAIHTRTSAARAADAIEDDEADGQPKQRRVPAGSTPPPATKGAASVFALAAAAKPKRAPQQALKPHQIQVRTGVPIPAQRRGKPVSAYAELWQRMPVGGMVTLTSRQAHSFSAWASKVGVRDQLVRRALGDGTAGVWRVEAKG
jgi:hypothetical protein